VLISRDIYEELITHASAEAPNECCGLLGTVDDRAVRFYAARNKEQSPMRFEIDPMDLYRINEEIEREGQGMVLFHSHPRTEAVPSQTDINHSERFPGVPWAICSLAEEPIVRLFEIADGVVGEVDLVVD
jgi:proteasome lid subunit RPN8/RPN11